MKLSKNFTLNEFTHSQMAIEQGILNEPDAEQREAIQQLVDHLLQPLRERVGEAIAITSGFRNQEVNRLVGGVHTSLIGLMIKKHSEKSAFLIKLCRYLLAIFPRKSA